MTTYAQIMLLARSGAILAALLISACGVAETPAPGAAESASTPSSDVRASSSSPDQNQSNPCLSKGGPEKAPGSTPDAGTYLGLTQNEAKGHAQENGQEIRVAGRDGKCFAMTMDYRSNRVNIYLDDAVVVAATIG